MAGASIMRGRLRVRKGEDVHGGAREVGTPRILGVRTSAVAVCELLLHGGRGVGTGLAWEEGLRAGGLAPLLPWVCVY